MQTTSLHLLAAPEHPPDGRAKSLATINHEQILLLRIDSPLDQIFQKPDRGLRVLAGPLDQSQDMLAPLGIDPQSRQKVQRCRLHKIRNVRRELPDELADQVVAVMKAAFRLEPKEGKVKLEQQAKWLATEYPGAAASLREGIDELFTVNDLGLPPSLFRCLTTTNIIESPFGTLQKPMRRVTRWRDGQMVTRWAASSFLTAEKKFRRIMGYSDLWMLEAALERKEVNSEGKAA